MTNFNSDFDFERNRIRYTDKRDYTQCQLQDLFQSVNWLSARYPQRLLKALNQCETVFTAWDGGNLVGLANAIDDGELTAYVHYLCVRPEYQGKGIGKTLLACMKDKYRDYLYLLIIAENGTLVNYYENNGFAKEAEAHAMAIQNLGTEQITT